MEGLKIAIIEPVGGHGGMDHYDYGLAQGLSQNDVSVHFYTCSETEQRNIRQVFVDYTFGHVWQYTNKWNKLWYYLRGHWNALQSAKKNGCKAVHLHFFSFDWLNFMVTFIVNLHGFKKVLTIHDVSDFRGGRSPLPRKYILSSFDHIIVHNEFSLRELRKIHNGENVSVIPHGHYLHSVEELPYNPNPEHPLNLLFFGQIKKVKGLDVLLRAMRIVVQENPNVSLQIAGKVWHDDLEQYQNLINELELVSYVKTNFSFIPNDEVSDYFRRADVVGRQIGSFQEICVLAFACSLVPFL